MNVKRMPMKGTEAFIYQLKVSLLETDPPIWRRFTVPSRIRLCCLHDVLQTVMGWADCHAHLFENDGGTWGVIQYDHEPGMADESRFALDKILSKAGDSLTYRYDFGDQWVHDLVLEKILPLNDSGNWLRCVAGERHCPPEDVGGTPGYQEFLEVIFQPNHEKFNHYMLWAHGPFQAEELDMAAINAVLSRIRLPIHHKR